MNQKEFLEEVLTSDICPDDFEMRYAFISLTEGRDASFSENVDTQTICLTIKDGDDKLSVYHIWGNNPISFIYKDDVKAVGTASPDLVAYLEPIIEKWLKTKKL